MDPAKQAHGVERLPDQFSTKTDKTKAIKLQIKYVKMFFDTKDEHLPVSNPSPEALACHTISLLEEAFGSQQEEEKDEKRNQHKEGGEEEAGNQYREG